MRRNRFATLLTFITVIFVAVLLAHSRAHAQTAPPRAQEERRQQQSAAPRAEADEEFDLDIKERRINEADYEASTTVEARDVGASGLSLRVGVAVRAQEIDVLLRNVRGHVRFRGSLDAVLRRLGLSRRAAPSADAPPNPSP